MIKLEKLTAERISNKPLRELVEKLKSGPCTEVDILRMTPDTAQQMYNDGPGHTDHTDYSDHTDTSTDPGHSDYCD